MGKKKSLGHSPFEALNKATSEVSASAEEIEVHETPVPEGPEKNLESIDKSNLDDLISTLLVQREATVSSLMSSKKENNSNEDDKPFLSKMKEYSLAIKDSYSAGLMEKFDKYISSK